MARILAMRVLPWIIVLPFAVALFVLPLPPRWAGRVSLAAPASTLLLGLPLWPAASAGPGARLPIAWLPSLGITADLRVDRLGAFFVLLIGAVGLAIVQYSRHYLKEKGKGPFWATLLAFMGSMLGIVLSDSLVLLFVFWELTTVTSALLIAVDFDDASARRGAIQAFLVTSGGALALLAGVVLLGRLAGTYSLSELELRGAALSADPAHALPLALLFLGAFTKSAQFPFHFWLPGAMAAPAPVSAYLHSATMVKAGVFLVGRLFPIFHTSPLWLPVLVTVGLTTLVVAGWQAVRAWDLKQLLAYSTAAYLGLLIALYGLYARAGTRGELVNIANHALYKSALFLLVGWLEKATGTRDLNLLRHERWCRTEPLGCVLIGIGAFALAGAPLLLSFLSKEILYEAVLAAYPSRLFRLSLPLLFSLVGSALAVTYALKLFISTFWGSQAPPEGRGYPRHEISRWLLAIPAALLLPQLAFGLAPGLLASALEPGLRWPGGAAVWHHVDALLALGITSYALGLGGYVAWRQLAVAPGPLPSETAIEVLARGAHSVAHRFSQAVQSGGHPRYLCIMLLTATAALGAPFALGPPARGAQDIMITLRVAWLPVAMIVAGAALTLLVQRRVTKLLMMALAGYGTALLYVLFRAPDLALTQILVETVSLLLLLLVFQRLPPLGRDARPALQRAAHVAIAALVGAGAAALAWTAGIYQAATPAGALQSELSLPAARGRNVVNVILVDFRGADTLGEIAVLAIATLGIAALLRAPRVPCPQSPEETRCDR